jgi:hypothetical protein
MKIIHEIREARKENHDVLQKELKKLLEWPIAYMSHLNYFWGAKNGTETFPRSANWLGNCGFHSFCTAYGFSNRLDKEEFKVTFYSLDDLKANTKVLSCGSSIEVVLWINMTSTLDLTVWCYWQNISVRVRTITYPDMAGLVLYMLDSKERSSSLQTILLAQNPTTLTSATLPATS